MNVRAYYNEIDPFAAQWLRNLISAGHIAPGDVDERSIVDVRPDDLAGYTQCHFFAGIGGWSYALRLAGWPDDQPVWTGSCPCQPFSTAGRGAGFSDERHLWPTWFRLIQERRPAILFGEQVASASAWARLVGRDLERENFSFAIRRLRALDCGAPHVRTRIFFVAYSEVLGRDATRPLENSSIGNPWEARAGGSLSSGNGPLRWAQSDVHLIADGIPNRVGQLRAYGNAIVPQVAAEFIGAAMSAVADTRRTAPGDTGLVPSLLNQDNPNE